MQLGFPAVMQMYKIKIEWLESWMHLVFCFWIASNQDDLLISEPFFPHAWPPVAAVKLPWVQGQITKQLYTCNGWEKLFVPGLLQVFPELPSPQAEGLPLPLPLWKRELFDLGWSQGTWGLLQLFPLWDVSSDHAFLVLQTGCAGRHEVCNVSMKCSS